MFYYRYVLLSILLGVLAQLFMKQGVLGMDDKWLSMAMQGVLSSLSVMPVLSILLGAFLYFMAMVSWVYALRNVALSKAYPLLSFSYPLVCLGAVVWPGINEDVNITSMIGIVLITVGALIVSTSPDAVSVKEV